MASPGLPEEVQEAVERAYSAMLRHPQSALLPAYRQAIYAALGPLADPSTPIDPLNDPETYRVRLTLDLFTVRRVLPIWESEQPQARWPQRLLRIVEGVLQKTVNPEVACTEADVASDQLDDHNFGKAESDAETASEEPGSKHISSSAYFVCSAALEALYDACGLYRFDGDPFSEQDTDDVLDAYSSDVAFWAADAYAGGLWDPQSDPSRRREFWEWWLKEAVSSAWETAT